MKKTRPSFKKPLFGILLLFVLYVLGILIHGTLTDYQPAEKELLELEGATGTALIPIDSSIRILNWNIGYAGLGAESDFFYHGGGFLTSGEKMIRPSETLCQKNMEGVLQLLQKHPAHFYNLQEVDQSSKRSYYDPQYDKIQKLLPTYAASFAINFDVKRVPAPVLQPWQAYGKALSGLTTISQFQATESIRWQLPGKNSWPNSLFQLDRCATTHRYKTSNGKEFVLINVHNAAYDSKGLLRSLQLDFLKKILLEEYQKGNYVIAAGDWNQPPPFFQCQRHFPTGSDHYINKNIPAELLPDGWQWIYDPVTPSVRSTSEVYQADKTAVALIDFYLLSPNMRARKVRTINHDFQFSDHQPVYLEAVFLK